ncbi:MAG TPA: arylsulfotransferase family protein [Phycisphaerae bacterium]|nr:arylsulfotransferase family protein [Phycisphaerae bacterium]HRW53772.1 arylsulfotransferase family protein [Phycisphaerae bacterium]
MMDSAPQRDGYRTFIASSLLLMFSYGVAVGMFHIFPYAFIRSALQGLGQLNGGNFIVYYHPVRNPNWKPIFNTADACDGLNLVTRIGDDDRLVAEVLDMEGRPLQTWNVDWFERWPDAEYLPSEVKPRSRPGCQIHGAVVAPNGDLVFNYDYLGLMRLGRDGATKWRLPYQTHHSVHLSDDGRLWVCGQERMFEDEKAHPWRTAPYDASTILEISPNGEILTKWSVEGLLRKNGYAGLLGLSHGFTNGYARQDILHLNDVETFPASMAEGFFKKGDILVSLRNISTIFVFERDTGKIKYLTTGQMVWQHDPDFIDGNRIAVFDNKGGGVLAGDAPASRLLVFTPGESEPEIRFTGAPEHPFYTKIMGKQQWLPNGNVLVTETDGGRGFEIDGAGRIVWQYVNFVKPHVVGIVQEVTRLPADMKRLFERPTGVARGASPIGLDKG